MTARVCAVAASLLVLGAAESMAQSVAAVDEVIPHVVRLRLAETSGRDGAGLIVGSTDRGLVIVTARHVVSPQVDGPCGPGVEAFFSWAQPSAVRATDIRCHPYLDVATVNVELPASEWTDRLKPMEEAEPFTAAAGYRVWVIGHPAGYGWSVNNANTVEQNNMSDNPDEFLTTGLAITPGYSGGPVLNQDGRLVGLMSGTLTGRAFALRWPRVREILTEWGTPLAFIGGAGAPPNPAFEDVALTPAEEAARNALRRYAAALLSKNRAEILAVRHDIRESEVEALFGDGSQVMFRLYGCTRMDARAADTGSVTCTQEMRVKRRTGRDACVGPSKVRFDLVRENVYWVIERASYSKMTPEETSSGREDERTLCSADAPSS